MAIVDRDLLLWAAAHHRVLTPEAMRRLGVSVHQVRRLVGAGVLERLVNGSYVLAGVDDLETARCVAASARPGRLVVASLTAGRRYGLRRMGPPGLVHVIAPPGSNPSRSDWIRPYRTAALDPVDIVERPDGIRLTSPARTLVDLSRHLTLDDLRSVLDQMLAERQTTVESIRRVAADIVTPGRPWVRRILTLLDRRSEGAAAESHWESRVHTELLRRGVVGLSAQYRLDVPHWGLVRLDLCVERLRWGIEIDGHPEHFTEVGGARDAGRDLACGAIGWQMSRVATWSLERDFRGTIDALWRVYLNRCAALGLSPV
jgi:very-short-patch-repair endonuclease